MVETFSELHTHAADGGLEVGGQALLDSLAESLTGGDGGDNALVHVSLHGAGLGTNVGAVLLVGLGDVVGNTGQLLGGTLGTRGVGSDDGGQHGHLGAEALLGALEGVAGRGGGSAGGGVQRLGGLGVELLHGSHLTVELLGGRLEVGGHLGGVPGVDTLGLGGDGQETDREVLAELLHLAGGGLAGGGEVLNSLGEAAVSEGGLLGERLVELLGGATELAVELGLVLGELLVGLAELVVGLLGGDLQLLLEEGEGRGLALGISGAELAEGNAGTALLVGDGSEGSLGLGSNGGTVSLGDLTHADREDVETVVHVLDLAGGLLTEGILGAGVKGDGVLDAAGNVLGVLLDGLGDGSTLEGGLGMRLGGLLLEGVHLLDGGLHGEAEVTLGNRGHGLHGVDHLALERGTGTLAFGGELVHGLVGLLLELGDLLLEVVVDQPLGVLVELLAELLNSLGTLLTGGDGLADGGTELVLVGLLEDGDLLAASGGLLGVAAHDTGELGNLLLGGAVVRGDLTAERVDLLAEGGLGVTDVPPGIELHAAGGGLESGVLLGLERTLGVESGPDLGGLLSEAVLGVLAVTGKGLADGVELGVEAVGHLVELASGLDLTLVDEALELSIVLEVGLVALVAKLDHAAGLGVDVVVHLGLGSTVLANHVGGGVHTVVHLGHLAADGGLQVEQAHLELGGGLGDLGLGLVAGSLDVTHSLGVAAVLERLLGVEGSSETHGGLTEGHVDFVTVLGHLGLDLGELGAGGGNHRVDLVGGPGTGGLVLRLELAAELAVGGLLTSGEAGDLVVPGVHGVVQVLAGLLGVLNDLGSVGSHVPVGASDLRVGRGRPSGGGLLPGRDSEAQVLGVLTTVGSNDGVGLPVATHGGLLATIGKGGLLGDLLEHLLAELVTSLGVEHEVKRNLS